MITIGVYGCFSCRGCTISTKVVCEHWIRLLMWPTGLYPDSPFTVVDAFSLSYQYLPFLVDFFYIFTYFVWWGDFIFRRLFNSVWLLAVKWENKKTSPQNSAQHVCWSFLLCTWAVILVLWLSPLILKGAEGYLPAGWRGGLHSHFLYHWRIKQTGHSHATLAI